MELLKEIISQNPRAPIIVLFGGNPSRRHEVIKVLQSLGDVTVYGTLSEEEGVQKIKELDRLDMVLIGGAYSIAQRERIQDFVNKEAPGASITQPGFHYPYSNSNIVKDIKSKLKL